MQVYRIRRSLGPALMLAAAALASASSAEARAIRVDPGGGSWEQNFDNVFDDPGDTGQVRLPFSFLGSDTLFIGPNGEQRQR
jgi:hypothetical protein